MNAAKKSWMKRFGLIGFLFFLIKGLLWLGAIYLGFSFFE